MENENGVIIITQDGKILESYVDDIDPHHWCCFVDLENKLNLESNCGTDQMEHAWYLARKGIISFQVVNVLSTIVVSPEVDMISPVQLEKMQEVIKNKFDNEDTFGVDLVSNDKHRPIIIGDNDEYGFDGLNEIFHFDDLEKHKTR